MANEMVLGSYTFAWNPSAFPMITKKRSAAGVETVGGVEFFSWGMFYAGQVITLSWSFMPTAQFTQLQTILEADAETTFAPQTGTTYTVQVMGLTGAAHIDQTSGAAYRKDVTLELLITGVSS